MISHSLRLRLQDNLYKHKESYLKVWAVRYGLQGFHLFFIRNPSGRKLALGVFVPEGGSYQFRRVEDKDG
jgi:hypothetical protein